MEVSCAHDQVLVSVDVRTVPCVYGGERPCGDHGSCQETHHGMFFFTTCLCHEGWSGWGCEERVDTQGLGSVLDSPVLLTLSNVFFLPPALLAAKRRLYSHALLFTATMVASVLYHTCDTDKQMLSHCVAEYSVLQFCDFFFSLLCFWFTVVGLGGISAGWSPLLHTCGVVVIAPAVQCSRTSLATFIVPMAAAAALLVSGFNHYFRTFFIISTVIVIQINA
ncbi:unnamed protein product [Meganyctiphanes norvegica]|uniref:EGF-like domain-containing protein n=1 Tax=Meganyctiphanes norvegica TaxID=48144 RepID=A0AAV2Q708_MEGNR